MKQILDYYNYRVQLEANGIEIDWRKVSRMMANIAGAGLHAAQNAAKPPGINPASLPTAQDVNRDEKPEGPEGGSQHPGGQEG